MSDYPRHFMTNEDAPRRMIAIGRSGIDPDVVVAYLDSDKKREKTLWLIDGGNPEKEVVTVIGLDDEKALPGTSTKPRIRAIRLAS